MSERIWRVRVAAWSQGKLKNKRVIRWFIVSAPDASSAMDLAKHHALKTAEFGPKWLGFEANECYSATLPLEIKP